ncbi:hypothetical protein SAMN06297387_1293 [Streptomyces zhaozhouensis]|uniref:Uncharacterized protein n=1 Tax=Streptomyces zhaozhouensis TaxID=1300267 RepID=A0A286E8A8_9ACTN|nr:hypothetical protein [Streptomyces zhaozhouensis]SOD67136.1 hypothetical protein SAMN06297387_1293 [Streptomyces zhaozhouensis]
MTRPPLPRTPRHEFPSDLRRRHTLDHIRECGIGAVARHPVTYRRWGPARSIAVTLGVFLGLGVLMGFGASSSGDVPFVVPPLAALGAWAVLYGLPVLLPLAVRDLRGRRRLNRAVSAIPHPRDHALPGWMGETPGLVSYDGGALRLHTARGVAMEAPFPGIYVVEELPPKGFSGLPGIDVLTTDGTWTEIRATDNKKLLTVLEQAGTPVLRAVNRF